MKLLADLKEDLQGGSWHRPGRPSTSRRLRSSLSSLRKSLPIKSGHKTNGLYVPFFSSRRGPRCTQRKDHDHVRREKNYDLSPEWKAGRKGIKGDVIPGREGGGIIGLIAWKDPITGDPACAYFKMEKEKINLEMKTRRHLLFQHIVSVFATCK